MGRKSRKAHRGKKMTLVKRSEKKAKMGDPKTNGNHGDGPSQTKKQKIESKKMNTEDNAHVFTVEMFPKSIKDKRSKDKERVHLSDMEYKMSKEGRGAEKKLSESVRRGVSLERSEKRKKRRIDNEDGSQLMSSSNDEKGDTFIETSLEKHSRTDIHVHSVNVDSMPWKQDETKRGEINLSGLKFFSTGISTECLAVMQDPSEMHFHGKVSMQVVSGSISVLGHCISAGSKEFSLYSPYCTSAMSVKTTKTFTNDGFSDSKLRKTLEDILVHADSNTLSNVLKKMTSHTVVILFKKLVCPATNYVTSFDFYNELFTRPISEVDYNKEFDVASSIGLHVVTDPGKPLFYLQSELKDITRTLLKSTVTRPVVLVCGGKNVGKSTYCRYLINSFLNKENSIDYLECDVGQTEFTPSSIISLTEVKEPLLGPPFTHLREPTIMSFFGDLSPKDDPERYIHTVRYVYNQCKKSQRPVVVNTMGWNKAMGLSLLLDVIRVIKPTHIIQFDTNVTSKNLPLLNDEYLNDNEGWCIPMTAEDDAAELLVAKC
uniref:Polynucleotide 5'-hydroxyl-kinase NOL9 n=1 Tax=Saccoglossus kowalevskii TaxID=10224 RepID=A0ABM0MKG2_SACKO|nr:PREDICTED: polynucleotide 5'-hydroxyl-kinase NOL9-like [Saccoglossus kowalevskii]